MTETHAGRCPVCSRTIRLPIETVDKRVECRDCATILRIGAGDDGSLALTPLDAARAAPGLDRSRADVEQRIATHGQRRNRRPKDANAEKELALGKAHRVLVMLALLFAGNGTFMGLREREDARYAHAVLGGPEPQRLVDIDGTQMSAAEVLRNIDFGVTLTFSINYLLAAIMLGLFFWALRSPYPALFTALCTYVVLLLVGAIADPTSLVKGIVMKGIIVTVMLGGMSAALKKPGRAGPRRHRAARSPAFAG